MELRSIIVIACCFFNHHANSTETKTVDVLLCANGKIVFEAKGGIFTYEEPTSPKSYWNIGEHYWGLSLDLSNCKNRLKGTSLNLTTIEGLAKLVNLHEDFVVFTSDSPADSINWIMKFNRDNCHNPDPTSTKFVCKLRYK